MAGVRLRRFRERDRPRRDARPADLSSEAQHIEHRRLVALDAGRKDRAFPRRPGKLESVELRQRFSQSVESGQPIDGIDVLPLEEEPHEVGRADRLDLGAQPVERVAVDAREERAVAPLDGLSLRLGA